MTTAGHCEEEEEPQEEEDMDLVESFCVWNSAEHRFESSRISVTTTLVIGFLCCYGRRHIVVVTLKSFVSATLVTR